MITYQLELSVGNEKFRRVKNLVEGLRQWVLTDIEDMDVWKGGRKPFSEFSRTWYQLFSLRNLVALDSDLFFDVVCGAN